MTGLQQTNARWRTRTVDRRPRLPLGTTFRFRLDRAAGVRFEFAQISPGRRIDARCVKPATANRGKPRCSRYETRGTVHVAGRAGANALTFRGRVQGRTLQPGSYRLRVTALADGKTSPAAAIRFTVAR